MTRPPALLFLGDYYGTIASARSLGRLGIPITLADSHRLARTTASRYVTERLRPPPLEQASEFMHWLLAQGPHQGGSVLFPASDELVFHFATYKAQLERHYRLCLPDLSTIFRILNKQRIYEACLKTGVSAPRTWFPRGIDELRALLSELDCEVILKPKTQIQLRSGTKAAEIPKNKDLGEAFTEFVADNPFGPELVAHDPDVVWPMVQAYHRKAAYGIYSLAGFATGDGRVLARASRKILQRPRKLGIGLCFEGVPLKQDLVDRVAALCKELGYYGIFEIEFIEHEDDFLLIDFNPRPYSQMAFEIARELPLPHLHYLTALGEVEAFERAWERAAAWQPQGSYAYCHETLLGLVIGAQTLSAILRGDRSERWDRWLTERRPNLTDAVRSASDVGPVLVDAALHGREALRHPRSFLRSFLRD